ncbi:MAG: hypothetical protein RIC55_08865 [Pirellulaceae bacterium]
MPPENVDDLAPWFVPYCLEAFGFLESEFGFDVQAKTLAYETVVLYRRGDVTIEIGCEIGCLPDVFINNLYVKDELADESFQTKWSNLQRGAPYDTDAPQYHHIVREVLADFRGVVRAHESLWR